MNDERTDRVKKIGAQVWTRHLDDRIGVSHEEIERMRRTPAPELPVDLRASTFHPPSLEMIADLGHGVIEERR